MRNAKTFVVALLTLTLTALSFAGPGDMSTDEAMAKLKAKEEARKAAAATQASADLVTARAANAELRKENESLKQELAQLKTELQQTRQQLAEAQQKAAKATASDTSKARRGSNIFEDLNN
jgi:DNA anti-recombination protein RmuC